MPQRKKRLKNPIAAGAEKKPFPFLDPDFPVKPWIDPVTAERFQTHTMPVEGGFLAVIVQAPEVSAQAKTRQGAEKAVLEKYRARWRNPQLRWDDADDDADDLRVIKAREKEPTVSYEEVAAEFGHTPRRLRRGR